MSEMVKNGIYLRGASKQNALFSKKYAPKNAPMPSLSRIGPGIKFDDLVPCYQKFQKLYMS